MEQERRDAIAGLGEENLQALRDMAAEPVEERQVPPSFFGVPDGPTNARLGDEYFHTGRDVSQGQQIHNGKQEDCAECDEIGLFYAVLGGQMITRDGRLVFATRKEWQSFPAGQKATLVSVGKRGPTFGSLPLMADGVPDPVARLIEVLTFVELTAEATSRHSAELERVAGLMRNRSQHERALLDRAAELIDPEIGSMAYEQRLDWLAKWREVTGRAG